MENLIVLGLLPGTNIQISFVFWLGVIIAGTFGVTVWLLRRVHLIRNWLIASMLFIKTRRRLQV